MRVLVTSMSGAGHVHPMVPLAAELQHAGHEVLWATPAVACPRVERAGFRAVPAGIGPDEYPRSAASPRTAIAALPARERRLASMPTRFGTIAAPPMHRDLVPIVDEYRPDVVIHDLVEFAVAPIAAARGIPHVTLSFGTVLPSRLRTAVTAAVADLWAAEGLAPSADAGLYDHLYLHPLPAGFGEAPPGGVTRSMRPMHFDGGLVADEPDAVRAFGRHRPGVYVTFGTVMAGGAPWRTVVDAVDGLDLDVVMTVGSQLDPASLGAVPENVRVEAYVPQARLLQRAAVVVSHAGSGTMFAAAARGIPQLCLPMGADQWENADALARAGAGITLEPDERQPDAVRRSVAALLDAPDVHRAAQLLAEGFAALPHPSEQVTTIEALAVHATRP